MGLQRFICVLLVVGLCTPYVASQYLVEWKWISGGNTTQQRGVYGTQGVASASNVPGGRMRAVEWYNPISQELWLFGGYGYASVGGIGTAVFHHIISV
jgi:hypothetical protein